MTAPLDLDAIRARLEQVEADRDRWKHAYDMADPLLTERDRLAAENTKLSSLLAYTRESRDAYAAALDRVQYLVDGWASTGEPATKERQAALHGAARRLRAAIEGTDS